MHQWKQWVVSASMATLVVVGVVGCGGGSSTTKKVYVAGDSLNDVGVYGMRFTIQSGDAKNPHRVWTEHVAASIGAAYPCAAYDGLQSFAAKSGCTAYAVGGAQINPAALTKTGTISPVVTSATIGSDTTPESVIQQIKDVGKNTFQYEDMVLVNGGGNDINVLLTSLSEGLLGYTPANAKAYKDVMRDLLPATTVDAAANTPGDLTVLGTQYMQALATSLSSAVKTELLAKEAQRVLVLNLPNVAKAPILNKNPPLVQELAGTLTRAFNTQLQKELGGESKVLIVDFDTQLGNWINNPTNAKLNGFNLTNVTAKACGTTPLSGCSDAVLNVSGPSDWKTHLFADDLHATPFANQLMGQWVTEQIKAKGW
ncbi:MAG: hypothetical protein RJB34_724 [Pseudomonadota bacterium]|jgi:phospholipase/lecithinase/hemolysin